ncbi:MAG: lysylphosphatidylglycerol synthase transmembrane domain-containing protein, partial [Fibrobacter sp.]|nr:lysylphosphatidylglycerol synthase transmembrane domain-containing protein [Fibrobacter sp.]
LWKRNGYTFVQSAGSLVVERVIDGLVFLAFFFVPVFFRSDLEGLTIYALIAFGLFCGIIAFFFLYSKYPHASMKFVDRMTAFLPAKVHKKALHISKELFDNLDWVSGGKQIFPICILSVLIIFCQALSMLLLAGWNSGVGILGSMFGASFAALGAAIPLSPGYIGTLHAVLLQGLSLLGVENRIAGAIAVLYHAIGYFTVTVIGLYYFFCTKVSVNEINKAGMEINRETLQER